jgi:hypothetical protein
MTVVFLTDRETARQAGGTRWCTMPDMDAETRNLVVRGGGRSPLTQLSPGRRPQYGNGSRTLLSPSQLASLHQDPELVDLRHSAHAHSVVEEKYRNGDGEHEVLGLKDDSGLRLASSMVQDGNRQKTYIVATYTGTIDEQDKNEAWFVDPDTPEDELVPPEELKPREKWAMVKKGYYTKSDAATDDSVFVKLIGTRGESGDRQLCACPPQLYPPPPAPPPPPPPPPPPTTALLVSPRERVGGRAGSCAPRSLTIAPAPRNNSPRPDALSAGANEARRGGARALPLGAAF